MHYFETNQTDSYKNEIHKRRKTKINGNVHIVKRLVKNKIKYDIHRDGRFNREFSPFIGRKLRVQHFQKNNNGINHIAC